ncbi:MAG: VacJ family lipoprotein [Candidatus Rokubacteria bacterium]|nr:VacJ family lipoprotein [Candidatus Rokubacteria bacterium]
MHGSAAFLGVVLLALALAGCGSLSGSVRADSALLADQPTTAAPEGAAGAAATRAPDEPKAAAPAVAQAPAAPTAPDASAGDGAERAPQLLAQTQREPQERVPTGGKADVDEEYDPWESFNEPMFEFNRKLDQYVLKPVAKGYNKVVNENVQVMIANGFDNIRFVPRLVNSLLQGKWHGALREFSRFVLNSTAGVGGLFDAAKHAGIEKSREDFGQTLAVWGSGPGPYLILPFLEPMTVRDGIGKGVDGVMDPLSWVLPFVWERLTMKVMDTVNDRSLNLELFQGFEESVIDMYSAVRHGYLRRREQLIKE